MSALLIRVRSSYPCSLCAPRFSGSPCQRPAVASKKPGGQPRSVGSATGWTTTITSTSVSRKGVGTASVSVPSGPTGAVVLILSIMPQCTTVPPKGAGLQPIRPGRLHIDFWSNACSLFSDFQPRRRGMPDKIGSEKAEGAAFVSPHRSPLLRENGQAFDDNIHMRLPCQYDLA